MLPREAVRTVCSSKGMQSSQRDFWTLNLQLNVIFLPWKNMED